jgi:hypothetical protein
MSTWVWHKRKGADQDEFVELTRNPLEATAEATRGLEEAEQRRQDRVEVEGAGALQRDGRPGVPRAPDTALCLRTARGEASNQRRGDRI